MKIVNLLLIALLLPQAAHALSLAEMQRAAIANRALVKRALSEIDKSAEEIRIARSGYYPDLDLRYRSYTLDEDTTVERSENAIASTTVSWNLFTGFSDRYEISSAQALKEVEERRLDSVEQDIQLNVALRYLDVYDQRARLEVAEDRNETLKGLYLDSQNRFDVGLLDRNEVLKFKVDFDNADLTVKREQARLEKAIIDLSREVGAEIGYAELDFAEFQNLPELGRRDGIERQMLADRSEIKVLEGLVEAAEHQIRAEYGDYYPQLDLIGRYARSDDALLTGQGDFTDEELRAELVLSYNLFAGFEDEAEIARAKADVRTLKFDLEELRDDLTTELKKLFVDYEISLANIDVARDDISAAEENLRITELKYKEGLQDQLDLLDAVANLTRAQSNFVAVVRAAFDNYFRIIRTIEGFPVEPR